MNRLFACGLCMVLAGCALPAVPHLPASIAQTKAAQVARDKVSALSISIDAQNRLHPNLSGYYPIATGANAFASRTLLTAMSHGSIDVSYYIWHNDEAGQLMLKDLYQAAMRGVQVRLLLDDFNNSPELDQQLLRFAQHENISVRLVNPTPNRHIRALGFLRYPRLLNARMHNKIMTFDDQISIIGGRNIGNEYLNNHQSLQFADLDVLLVGEVVGDISQSFDAYWDAPNAYDIETIVSPDKTSARLLLTQDFIGGLDLIDEDYELNTVPVDAKTRLFEKLYTQETRAQGESHGARLSDYRQAIISSTLIDDLIDQRVPLRWVDMVFFADDPAKLMGANTRMLDDLRATVGRPKDEVSIISSYFVPTKKGADELVALARSGVQVRILTNSYDATDVGAVHAGYAPHRLQLLKAGVELYELKKDAITQDEDNNNRLWRARQKSNTSLHIKAFAIDGHQSFIGSYNLDPRSANINTELGVLIFDERLTQKIHQAFNDDLLDHAYRLGLNGDHITWTTREDDGVLHIHTVEPHTTAINRAGVSFMSALPIDWLL